MTEFTKEMIYNLLPAVYREKDKNEGKPLESLIEILSEQIQVVEDDIGKLYDNWFIETCDSWAVPYIGNLLGVKGIRKSGKFTPSQRSQIANTILYRRAKGTLFVLEQIAYDTTKWHAHTVEFFKNLSRTQYLNHVKTKDPWMISLRDKKLLKSIDTPFDKSMHNVDVRNISSKRGYHNIQNVGFFFWRIQPLPVVNATAFQHDLNGRFYFSQTGHDTQLFNYPHTENNFNHITEEHNLPIPIDVDMLRNDLVKEDSKYYSDKLPNTKAITVIADGKPISQEDIVSCDLSQWQDFEPKKDKVAIDPTLGRIYFPTNRIPNKVRVIYYYGLPSEIGSGFFKRESSDSLQQTSDDELCEYLVSSRDPSSKTSNNITDAITKLNEDNPKKAVILIKDSETYDESISVLIPKNCQFLYIRADPGQRPTILTDSQITMKSKSKNSHVEFDGLLIARKGNVTSSDPLVKINPTSKIGEIILRYCTLVPTYLMNNGGQKSKVFPSVTVGSGNNLLKMTVTHSITGPITSSNTRSSFTIQDSILDGSKDSPSLISHIANLKNTTIFGPVTVDRVDATNTLFDEPIVATRTQEGCVRFCYLPEGSKTPMPYRCPPNYLNSSKDISNDMKLKVKPRFTSKMFGHFSYAQLHTSTAKQISEGGDNESELGVYNSLYQPQRLHNFMDGLDEYVRFGTQAGVFFIT